MTKQKIVFFLFLIFGTSATVQAAGLVIHAAEVGVGKFHRFDNTMHPYGDTNAWTDYIMAPTASTETPVVVSNVDHSVTIFFSSLEELIQTATQVAKARGEKIWIFNIN